MEGNMKTNKYLKKWLAMLIALMMLVSLVSLGALAANEEAEDEDVVTTENGEDENGDGENAVTTGTEEDSAAAEAKAAAELRAAEALYVIGLFRGVGDDADGRPVFDLESSSTRLHGIIMLIRLLGAEALALSGDYESPFTDVPDGYEGYVSYAFYMGWTKGVSEELFDPNGELTATQFLTFMLRALGYVDGVDFEWNAAWELSDDLGITDGEYGPDNNTLIRGEMAYISLLVLTQEIKGSGQTLIITLIVQGVFDRLAEEGLIADEAILAALEAGDLDLFAELIIEDVYDAAGLEVPTDTDDGDEDRVQQRIRVVPFPSPPQCALILCP